MKKNTINIDDNQLKFDALEAIPYSVGSIILNKEQLVNIFAELNNYNDLQTIKDKTNAIKRIISNKSNDNLSILNIELNGDTLSIRKDIFTSELNQILDAKTIERAKYYLKRLEKSIQKIKTNRINDINLLRWKEYDNIMTDSLWILDKRDSSGAHLGWYWGNFIPQIPNQLMLRYTKKGDWVLDTFVGSGTTLIECRRLGRNGIGIELNHNVANEAIKLISQERNKFNITSDIIIGDSTKIELNKVLQKYGIKQVQLIIMHPPYFDIIKFSDNQNDLSNAENIEDFLNMFGKVVENTSPYLSKNRYLALVIGDKYHKGEWIPLGFYCMNEVIKRGFSLKSIIVKNFEETRGKRNQKELWRYRALVGGFYIFKHEYIMIFKKL